MRRIGGLWEKFCRFDNLLLAYKKARKGKQSRPQVAQFSLELERNLCVLQEELETDQYAPGEYRQFTIYERKPRVISAAPFRDRVVHHALMNVIEPRLDRRFIETSYACRKGKGVHAAVDQYQIWSKRYAYVLKMDVSRYFPSIDHVCLKQKLKNKIKDLKILNLLNLIIDQSPFNIVSGPFFAEDDLLTLVERRRGIPIGNLTSQFFANLYLDDFDHWMKQTMQAKHYLRYVDDMVVVSDDLLWLREIRASVRTRLTQDRLVLHPFKAEISRTRLGLDLFGYRVFPDFRLLRNDNGFRFARKLRRFSKQYFKGRTRFDDFNPSVQSWIGHAKQANTFGLRQALFDNIVFRGQIKNEPACSSRRLLEQQCAEPACGEPEQQYA